MPRSVNAVASRARRKKVMKLAKGYFGRRKNVWTVAKNAVEKAMQYAYRGRKEKKFPCTLDHAYQRWCKRTWDVLLSVYGSMQEK